ncbi:hypothetical protein HPB48_009039 [Haemaphysalis longicornis]|uniref:Uncharacterized protein n=1 Tax=Haemaphysalis longicornis TaxID=44386 RepID=A0A9J6H0X2_HAELO|nr:hypothetical protein HPB48_009039 [Haemaphysalis longicornis]
MSSSRKPHGHRYLRFLTGALHTVSYPCPNAAQEDGEVLCQVLPKELTTADKLEFRGLLVRYDCHQRHPHHPGSCLKIQLEQRVIDGQQYNLCSTLLGTGNLLVWAGVLRYLGFFKKYNILILTMRRAFPEHPPLPTSAPLLSTADSVSVAGSSWGHTTSSSLAQHDLGVPLCTHER